jgi:hypothetical protein
VRPGWLILLLLWSSGVMAAAPDEGYRFKRDLQVPETGWVRVPLDGRIIAQAQPGGHWNLMAPDGRAVHFNVLSVHSGFLEARTVTLDENPEGWQIVFDLGPTPVRHHRLDIDLVRPASAAGCRVEGSHDLESWHSLGEGTLFRLGAGEMLHGSGLEYRETDLRFLRLWWPKAAGFPEFRTVGVQSLPEPPGDPLTVAVELRREASSGGASRYRLHLPGPGMNIRRLVLIGVGDGGEEVAYRLYRAAWQRWTIVAEGRFKAGEPPIIDIGGRRIGRTQLRLELYADDGEDIDIEEAALEIPAAWLLFHAEQPGRHALVYGGTPAMERVSLTDDLAVGPVVEIRAGDNEEPLPLPDIPERLVIPVPPEEPGKTVTEWPVDTRHAKAGDVVRLILPYAVRGDVGYSINQLRLQTKGDEIPYLITTPEEPEAEIVLEDLSAAPVSGGRYHRIAVKDARLSPLLSQVEIFAAGRHFERQLRVLFPIDSRPGMESDGVEIQVRWQCGAPDAVPCRAVIDQVPAGASGEMEILVENDGSPTMGPFTLRGWTARPALVFVHPGADDLSLLWDRGGKPGTRSYPLEKYAALLLAMPWSEAGLDIASAQQLKSRRELLSKSAMIAMLVLGAIALLWILARNLRH